MQLSSLSRFCSFALTAFCAAGPRRYVNVNSLISISFVPWGVRYFTLLAAFMVSSSLDSMCCRFMIVLNRHSCSSVAGSTPTARLVAACMLKYSSISICCLVVRCLMSFGVGFSGGVLLSSLRMIAIVLFLALVSWVSERVVSSSQSSRRALKLLVFCCVGLLLVFVGENPSFV